VEEVDQLTDQGQTGTSDNLALATWAGWSAARWAATSNVEGGSGTEEGANGHYLGGRALLV